MKESLNVWFCFVIKEKTIIIVFKIVNVFLYCDMTDSFYIDTSLLLDHMCTDIFCFCLCMLHIAFLSRSFSL